MPKITLRLNNASIFAAIKEVEEYKNDIPRKTRLIREKVTEELEKLVAEGFNGAFYDDLLYEGWKVQSVRVDSQNGDKASVVIAHGKEAVFIEFGAGVYYNPSGATHPWRVGDIVAIGSYGHGYGKREIWGYWPEGVEHTEENLVLTHGTPASMPMYHAALSIARKFPEIAKEVFKGG